MRPQLQTPILPHYKTQETLIRAADQETLPYVKAPHLLFLDEHNVLVAYKRGTRHNTEPAADWEMFRYDPTTGAISDRKIVAHLNGFTIQNGEFVRFANGDIGLYVDPHFPNSKDKFGLLAYRSSDHGTHFEGGEKLGPINGTEYVYAFESLTEGETTYMLLTPYRHYRNNSPNVDVIRSDDNGKSWQFVANLTKAFGNAPINETSFLRYENGYIFNTRGLDGIQRMHLTDESFRTIREVNLTETHTFIRAQIGRPRLFERDGGHYFIGRNYMESIRGMKLCLFKFDPESLDILSYAILDNYEGAIVPDGYYAMPYFTTRGGNVYFNVITYKSLHHRESPPDLIRLEFKWDELR